MHTDGWKYYNHAAIPTTAPHEEPNIAPLQDNSIWKIDGGTPLLARWTTEFDCGYETNWWYVIKDTPFDINALKAKRRYEINKGIKHFSVREIDPYNYTEAIYEVRIAACSGYPNYYCSSVDKNLFISSVRQWHRYYTCIGAFDRETNTLCGYALLAKEHDKYVRFSILRTNPDCERNGVNAALVEGVLRYFNSFLESGGYICDGARSINHETAFQDYLEKYFGFRKAYCKLHVKYRPGFGWIIKLMYPLRKIFAKLDGIGFVHLINSVLQMEEIARKEI